MRAIAGTSRLRTTNVSTRTPRATANPSWNSCSSGSSVEHEEGPGEDQPGARDHRARLLQARDDAGPGADAAGFLAHAAIRKML